MNKEMQGKITRILYLLNELDKGTINLARQAGSIGFTSRTLQRDINAIEEAGFPLYSPKPGLYAFAEGFSLGKMSISDKEASLLVLLADTASSLGKDFEKSFNFIRQRFININQENPFFIKVPIGTQYAQNDVTKVLEKAIKAKHILTIYYIGGTKPGYYKIKPLKIVYYEGFWYLVGINTRDLLFKFRLDEITWTKERDEIFKYTGNINKILKESVNIWFEENRNIEIKLEIAKEIAAYFKAKEYFPLQEIKKENKNGSIVVTCKTAKFSEVLPTIFHWLPYIKVLAPIELKQIVKGKVVEYSKRLD
jgi:predicted DNA-binding transcriptional regulator YafY